MLRRCLIALSITAAMLGVTILGLALWLGGRPWSYQAPRGPTIVDGPPPCDLIPPSSTPIDVNGSVTGLAPQPPPLPGAPPLPLIRTETRVTPPLRWTLNILLVGLDRRPGTSSGGRTDTILVAVLDRTSEHVGLISIPRDLYVEVPDHGPARINAAYGIGQRQHRDGLAVLERVVEDTLSIPIHHRIAVDLAGFEHSIDAVGGVVVDVPCPIQDNFVDLRDPSGRRPLDVPAGRQLMNGTTALMYVRSRHGRSDWDRARRQQAVLVALKTRLLSAGGISLIPTIWDQLGDSIQTDMTRLDILSLTQRAAGINLQQIHGLVLGHRHTEHWTTPEGQWVLLPQFEAIDTALVGLFSEPSPSGRPEGERCPAADVALTRPNREALRRRAREIQAASPHSSPSTPAP